MVRSTAGRENCGVQWLMAGCLLLACTAGCGPPASDKQATTELRASNATPEDRTAGVQPKPVKAGQDNPAQQTAASPAGGTLPLTVVPRDADDRLNIPDAIAKDLGSSDARERYRALEYWEKKDSKAPIDPIYDLMEDDDPAVRARAAAILERYTEAGVERE